MTWIPARTIATVHAARAQRSAWRDRRMRTSPAAQASVARIMVVRTAMRGVIGKIARVDAHYLACLAPPGEEIGMGLVRKTAVTLLVVVAVLAIFVGGWLTGRTGIGSVVDPASLSEAERKFAERMRDVDLVGSFTVAGREERSPRPDRYGIKSVEKV